MIIAAMALAVHWVAWPPALIQKGVSIGSGTQERLILMVPADGCGAGLRAYSARAGELEAALDFLKRSKVCDKVDEARMERDIQRASTRGINQ